MAIRLNRKDRRPFRAVIKNLQHSTIITIIKEILEETGNIVIGEIINAKCMVLKRNLLFNFFATLQQRLNIDFI